MAGEARHNKNDSQAGGGRNSRLERTKKGGQQSEFRGRGR